MFGTAIKINGKTYYLKLRVNDIIRMKAEGVDIMKLDEGVDFDLELIRTIFYFALQTYHKDEVTSVEKAGELMGDYLDNEEYGDFQELTKLVMIAVSNSMGAKRAKMAEKMFDQAMEEAQQEGKLNK